MTRHTHMRTYIMLLNGTFDKDSAYCFSLLKWNQFDDSRARNSHTIYALNVCKRFRRIVKAKTKLKTKQLEWWRQTKFNSDTCNYCEIFQKWILPPDIGKSKQMTDGFKTVILVCPAHLYIWHLVNDLFWLGPWSKYS